MGQAASGFEYVVRASGDVQITHRGRPAVVLRGDLAKRFLVDVREQDPQELMARLTGHYKRGTERLARRHPRNRDRI
ncbi:MAG: hypothetical protein M3025_03095 [Actinomycetota bacterium]|nr:hypothetical protein [Actinomycetota bacterium]